MCNNEEVVTKDHKLCNQEWEIYHKDGRKLMIAMSKTPLLGEDGQSYMLAIIQDITDRKQTELRLKQQATQEHLLSAITQRIRQSLDLQTTFETAVQEVRQFLSADRVGIFKFYPDSNFDDGEFVAEVVLPEFDSVIATKIHDHCFGQTYAAFYAQGKIQAVNDIYNAG
ncbi:MAG: PAS domain S-box protein, partial [Pseudanabaena sp.]